MSDAVAEAILQNSVMKWPPDFETFQKIPRLCREVVITEKMDGTNAQVFVPPDPALPLAIGSRNRWITPGKLTDNYDFARWVMDNEEAIRRLGPGRHFGEWWGVGIARRYNISERRWSLFNATQWTDQELHDRGLPANVTVVPILYRGELEPNWDGTACVRSPAWIAVARLRHDGSVAAPGFMNPEGIVLFHRAMGRLAKWTFDGDARDARRTPSPEEGSSAPVEDTATKDQAPS